MKNSSANKGKQEEIDTIDELKLVSLKGDSSNSPFRIKVPRNKKFNSKDILRLHSQLIRSFINGTIESNEAKTLSYLCSNYLEALGQVEVEIRLEMLEEKLSDEKF